MAGFRYNFCVNGSCRESNGEPYRSEPYRSASLRRTTNVCRYFLRGRCVFGTRCRFLHPTNAARPAPNTPEVQPEEPRPSGHDLSENVGECSSSQRLPGTYPECSRDWVDAPEFIPSKESSSGGPKSYAQALNGEACCSSTPEMPCVPCDDRPFCPKFKHDLACEKGDNCQFIHGEVCEICGMAVLNPYDVHQQTKHKQECAAFRERNENYKKALKRSSDKSCGICMELIVEKHSREQRFGILPNCNHCFCLKCIRKWRQAKQFENKIIRACPECRVTSDFVCPSMFWVDTKEEKETLIKDYKKALSVKNCKYFNAGRGTCPFGNKCFYLHAYPDGTKADVGPPVRQRRQNSDGDFRILERIILYDFLEERENQWLLNNLEDFEDLVTILSDTSDDSDWSDYDLLF